MRILILLLIATTAQAQTNMQGKYIEVDSTFAAMMANTLTTDKVHQYNFGIAVKTIGGRFVTPAINYLYFPFPDEVTIEKLPIDSFPKPTLSTINIVTPTSK